MLTFNKLYRTMEARRANGKFISYPFIVQLSTGDRVVAWFDYSISSVTKDGVIIHICTIWFMKPEEKPYRIKIRMDLPFLIADNPNASYIEYMESLDDMYRNFSEKRMDDMLKEKTHVPMLWAYQCVRDYLKDVVKKL